MQNFFSPKISTLYSSGHRNSQYRFHLTSNGARGIVQKKKKKKHAHARPIPCFVGARIVGRIQCLAFRVDEPIGLA